MERLFLLFEIESFISRISVYIEANVLKVMYISNKSP